MRVESIQKLSALIFNTNDPKTKIIDIFEQQLAAAAAHFQTNVYFKLLF